MFGLSPHGVGAEIVGEALGLEAGASLVGETVLGLEVGALVGEAVGLDESDGQVPQLTLQFSAASG